MVTYNISLPAVTTTHLTKISMTTNKILSSIYDFALGYNKVKEAKQAKMVYGIFVGLSSHESPKEIIYNPKTIVEILEKSEHNTHRDKYIKVYYVFSSREIVRWKFVNEPILYIKDKYAKISTGLPCFINDTIQNIVGVHHEHIQEAQSMYLEEIQNLCNEDSSDEIYYENKIMPILQIITLLLSEKCNNL